MIEVRENTTGRLLRDQLDLVEWGNTVMVPLAEYDDFENWIKFLNSMREDFGETLDFSRPWGSDSSS